MRSESVGLPGHGLGVSGLAPQVLQLSSSDGLPSLLHGSLALGAGPSLWLLRRQDHRLRDGQGCLTPLALALLSQLSPAEQRRWQRQRHGPTQDLQLLARSGLRQLLGRYLNLAPKRVPLTRDRHHKPQLAPEASDTLAFNVSHAGELVLIGLHQSKAIGVDLESMATAAALQAQGELLPVAAQVLPPASCAVLSSLTAQQQQREFLQRWCQREAALKAMGLGLPGLAALGSDARCHDSHCQSVVLPLDYVGSCCVLEA